MDLFDHTKSENTPLAERIRPKTLDDFVGQTHLVSQGKILKELLSKDSLPSLIFWGPPGSGKTTLARIIANHTKSNFVELSAVSAGVADMKKVFEEAKAKQQLYGVQTILFVDEIHRFNKAQQDSLLPFVEKGVVILIGATTENPSFEVISPLLSRSRVLVLGQLEKENLGNILRRALQEDAKLRSSGKSISEEAFDFLTSYVNGDARKLLNTLEISVELAKSDEVSLSDIREALQEFTLRYDKTGDEHYDTISAFIKSMRGSDPDAALYYLARMLESGEDPIFIARRMVVFASEDVGNADPTALPLAVAVFGACEKIGMPECRINLAQGVTYLSTAPKSNASYLGIEAALSEVRQSGNLPIPLHIRNAPTNLMKKLGYGKGYKYAHNYKDAKIDQQHLPDKIKEKKFYDPAKDKRKESLRGKDS